MQARFAAFSALALALVASPAFAQTAACPETEHDRHIFVTEAAAPSGATGGHYVGSANGGVGKPTDGGRPAEPAGPSSNVAAAPAEAGGDYLLNLGGVDGESRAGHPAGDGVVVLNSGTTATTDP